MSKANLTRSLNPDGTTLSGEIIDDIGTVVKALDPETADALAYLIAESRWARPAMGHAIRAVAKANDPDFTIALLAKLIEEE